MTTKLKVQPHGDKWAAVEESGYFTMIVRTSRAEVASYVEGWNDAVDYVAAENE